MTIEGGNPNEVYEAAKLKLGHLVPDLELKIKSEVIFAINKKKREKGALILGHNYMEPSVFYGVCDIIGDSLELSRKAAEAQSETIIFCGVRFMAETAKILNPSRRVLLPAKVAGCSLAASITAEDVRNLRKRYPGCPIVTYINTYADVKAECDIVCTSGNAANVVRSLKSDTILFLPDEYLAKNIAAETGKTIICESPASLRQAAKPKALQVVGWEGRCEVHELFTVKDITDARAQFPGLFVLAHPECHPDVVAAADFADSTSRMVRKVKETDAPAYLILTECSMGDNIMAENPEKNIVRLCSHRCPHMNEITLEDILRALETNQTEIFVEEDIRVRAKRSLDAMLAIA